MLSWLLGVVALLLELVTEMQASHEENVHTQRIQGTLLKEFAYFIAMSFLWVDAENRKEDEENRGD